MFRRTRVATSGVHLLREVHRKDSNLHGGGANRPLPSFASRFFLSWDFLASFLTLLFMEFEPARCPVRNIPLLTPVPKIHPIVFPLFDISPSAANAAVYFSYVSCGLYEHFWLRLNGITISPHQEEKDPYSDAFLSGCPSRSGRPSWPSTYCIIRWKKVETVAALGTLRYS